MKKALIILMCCLLLCSCGKQTEQAPELLEAAGAQPDTVAASRGDIIVQSVYRAAFAPRYIAMYYDHDTIVGEMNVSIGSVVKKGDVLISKDISSLNGRIAALDAEEAALTSDEAAEKEMYDIDMELYDLYIERSSGDEKYSLETEKEVKELEYTNAKSERAQRLSAIADERASLEAQLDGISLISPSNGRVSYLSAYPGAYLGAYETACIITDEDDTVLQSEFISAAALESATNVYALYNGERLEIEPVAVDEEEYARAALKGAASYSEFTFTGECPIGDTAVIIVERVLAQNVITVPVNAVYSENGEYYVYVDADGVRSRVNVTVGESNASVIEITSDLSEGSEVYVGD